MINVLFVILLFICSLGILSKINIKKVNNNSNYFYINYCLEFKDLISYWNSTYTESDNKRIKNLEDYGKLKTQTSKIVFLFNLLLDISEVNSYIRIYMAKVPSINSEYFSTVKNCLSLLKNDLDKSMEIYEDISEDLYFEVYKETVYTCICEFNDVYIFLEKMNDSMFTNIVCGIKNILDIPPYFQELSIATDKVGKTFEELQEIINKNDYTFVRLKQLDTQKYKEQTL